MNHLFICHATQKAVVVKTLRIKYFDVAWNIVYCKPKPDMWFLVPRLTWTYAGSSSLGHMRPLDFLLPSTANCSLSTTDHQSHNGNKVQNYWDNAGWDGGCDPSGAGSENSQGRFLFSCSWVCLPELRVSASFFTAKLRIQRWFDSNQCSYGRQVLDTISISLPSIWIP